MGSKEEALTEEVVRSFAGTADPRLHEVFESLVHHLHAFVSDVRPTIEEWGAAVDFLTRTGQACTDTRQEFILLSDVLGVSMLVETINDEETPDATESTVLGPFHMVESPPRESGDNISPRSAGPLCVVSGRVLSGSGEPIEGATVDIWQADTEGFYDVQQPEEQGIGNGRALLTTDAEGRFWFRSVVPRYYPIPTDGPVGELLGAAGRHPYRPAHIHFLVSAPGFTTLTTHVFVEGSEYVDSDAVFAVKESLLTPFTTNTDPAAAAELGVQSPFEEARIDLRLHPEDAGA
jgi:protocatechuate 3,4-dioxygenase beta subunit